MVYMHMGDAPIKVPRHRKKLAEGHINISVTLLVQTKSSTDSEWVAATQLKSAEFFVCTRRATEIFDVHTDFTAGELLHLYRSITPSRPKAIPSDPKPPQSHPKPIQAAHAVPALGHRNRMGVGLRIGTGVGLGIGTGGSCNWLSIPADRFVDPGSYNWYPPVQVRDLNSRASGAQGID